MDSADQAPPFTFVSNHKNFWESHMVALLATTNSIIYMDEMKNFIIRGDGVRLHIPFDFLVMCPEDDLFQIIINGIEISRRNRNWFGY